MIGLENFKADLGKRFQLDYFTYCIDRILLKCLILNKDHDPVKMHTKIFKNIYNFKKSWRHSFSWFKESLDNSDKL